MGSSSGMPSKQSKNEDAEMTDAPAADAPAPTNSAQNPKPTTSSSTLISTTPIPLPPMPHSASRPSQPSQAQPQVPASSPSILETTEKPAMAPAKKKGQAATKKAPKKPKSGTGPSKVPKSTKKAAASKKKKEGQPPKEQQGSGSDEADGSGSDDEESDHGPYCICRGPDDHRFMIGCDICEDWFHGECVNIDKDVGENLIERFVCPNCTDLSKNVQTLFKKTCSYRDCVMPARLYDGQKEKNRSAFCSDEHKQLWWEQMVAELPRKSSLQPAMRDDLTQEEFMALLSSANLVNVDKKEGTFKVTTRPFAPPEDLDDQGDSKKSVAPGTLTAEEDSLIQTSASDRYKMGEEIVLCQKMLQLMDMASERRKTLVSSKQIEDGACGYDFRLDTVGAQAAFSRWLNTDEGKEIFKSSNDEGLGYGSVLSGEEKNMCDKKRCKPHQGWYAILTRDVKQHMKQLAADANKKLNREREIRNSALERKLRKAREGNAVQRLD